MTTQAQTLLSQLSKLPLAERTELETRLQEMNEREIINWVDGEVQAGRMRTWSREESDAQSRQIAQEVRERRARNA